MDKTGLGQVKNLIMLALADGKASESELAMIAAVATRESLSAEELDSLLEHPGRVRIDLPEEEATRLRYLEDMVELMMVDGEMNDTELALCKIYAIALGYESTSVEQIVLDIASRLEQG